MRVLLISPRTESLTGGIAVWTEHYLSGCKNAGIECDLVNTAMVGKRAVSATARRCFKDEFIRTRRIKKQLSERLHDATYDVVHFNTNVGAFGMIRDYYLSKHIYKTGIPVVLHFHCNVPDCVNNPVIRYYLKKILKLSRLNFVLCKGSGDYLKSEFNTDSVMVPNFVDGSLIAKHKEIRTELKKAVFVGRVSVQKGAKEIFELARKLPEIQFTLVGEVDNEVALWNKPCNVHLVGIKSQVEVIEYLDDADVFVFPSHTEGFSLALAEAMARGLPALVTDVGANADMLGEQGGIVASVSDTDAMARALEVMRDPMIRKNMSERNINQVRCCYQTDEIVRLFRNSYSAAVKR